MLRSFLHRFARKRKAVEDPAGSILKGLIPSCPHCDQKLNDHQYRLIASIVSEPGHLDTFRELLSAIEKHEWQKVRTFQRWEGGRTNAEVYELKCPDAARSVVVVSAPFALEEPYTLMHQEEADDVAVPGIPNESDAWHTIRG